MQNNRIIEEFITVRNIREAGNRNSVFSHTVIMCERRGELCVVVDDDGGKDLVDPTSWCPQAEQFSFTNQPQSSINQHLQLWFSALC